MTAVNPINAGINYIGKLKGVTLNFPAPDDRRGLRQFLEMVGYYQSFCQNFSSIVSPLTDLLSPTVAFEWIEKCQGAFETTVKGILLSSPMLLAPD